MELLERDAPLQELQEAWDNAAAGNGRFALISGQAGIGKTSLVEHFTQRLEKNQRVLWGTCDALFTPRPLGPLHDIAGQVKGEFGTLFQAKINRPVLFSACLNEFQTPPTIVVVEDIHWADEATLDLLKFLGRRIQRTATLMIVTYRDDELSQQHPLRLLLGDLATSTAAQRISLNPLSLESVNHLAAHSSVNGETLHRLTGGNPFFVSELLAGSQERIPATIRDAVLARAVRLSLSGRAVLNAAAIIGSRIEPWLLAEVTRAEADAVDACLAQGILLAQGNILAFPHDLTRQTILETIPPHQRIFWHQAVLDALKMSPVTEKDVTRLAHHAEGANDAKAILTYARAAGGEAAALGMHRAAAVQFALALRYAADLPLLEQIELNEAYALSVQGDPARKATISAYQRAAELAHQAELPKREGFNLVRLAGTLDVVGQIDEAEQRLNEALALLEPLAPNRGLIDAYRLLAMKNLSNGDAKTAVSYAEKSYQMALETEQNHIIVSTYQIMGLCWLPLDHQRGCDHLEKCLTLALDNKQYWTAAGLYPNLIMTYVDVYKLHRANQLLQVALPYTIDHDMDAGTHFLQAWQAMLLLYQGQWRESMAIADTLLQHDVLQPGSRNASLAAKGRLLARQGEMESAFKLLDEALEHSLKLGNQQRLGIYYCARTEAAWLAKDRQAVLQYSAAFFDIALQNKQPGFAAELAYWRRQAGESVPTFDWMLPPFVLQIKGDWQGAAAAWEALGCPYEQARALAEGDTEAQIAALVILEEMGARPLADVVRDKLLAAGIKHFPRGRRATTRKNPFGLTNRQLEILLLLTKNFTNAEIAEQLHISPKTVDHHVSAVLAKLGVKSREAAAELARQQPDIKPSYPQVPSSM